MLGTYQDHAVSCQETLSTVLQMFLDSIEYDQYLVSVSSLSTSKLLWVYLQQNGFLEVDHLAVIFTASLSSDWHCRRQEQMGFQNFSECLLSNVKIR